MQISADWKNQSGTQEFRERRKKSDQEQQHRLDNAPARRPVASQISRKIGLPDL
jgi:hypothetical protein